MSTHPTPPATPGTLQGRPLLVVSTPRDPTAVSALLEAGVDVVFLSVGWAPEPDGEVKWPAADLKGWLEDLPRERIGILIEPYLGEVQVEAAVAWLRAHPVGHLACCSVSHADLEEAASALGITPWMFKQLPEDTNDLTALPWRAASPPTPHYHAWDVLSCYSNGWDMVEHCVWTPAELARAARFHPLVLSVDRLPERLDEMLRDLPAVCGYWVSLAQSDATHVTGLVGWEATLDEIRQLVPRLHAHTRRDAHQGCDGVAADQREHLVELEWINAEHPPPRRLLRQFDLLTQQGNDALVHSYATPTHHNALWATWNPEVTLERVRAWLATQGAPTTLVRFHTPY